jgi:lipopolysaccharide transport protein LptA/LPS export ABC transporter protein LptC
MTSDVHHPYALSGRDFLKSPSMREREKSLKNARSHSRLVSRLRIALPILAVSIFGLYFTSTKLQVSIGDIDASVSSVVIEKGNLRMVNPKLEGANKDKGVYVVTADFAEQAVANPDIIHLTEIKAEMTDAQKSWSRLTAPKGKFETKSEKLQLIGDIRASQSTGMVAHLKQADVDLKAQIVVSKVPVTITFPGGVLNSHSMHLTMPTREVVFDGDVQVRMEQENKPAKVTKKTDGAGQSFVAAFKSDQPVDISAPKLMIFDDKKLAFFTGGVTTKQSGSQMTSNELKVVYANDEKENPEGVRPAQNESEVKPAGKLSLIEAIGDVRILTTDGRRASATRLIYDSAKRELTLDENVTLTQKNNTLTGKRMVTDLATNITRFPPVGRVHGHFTPPASKSKPSKKVPAAVKSETVKVGTSQFDLSGARGKPVDIEADTLVIFDAKKLAEFNGNVKASQGKMTMRSKHLKVKYSGEAAKDSSGKKAGGGNISSIRAEGKVLINTADDQSTTSDWALFDVVSQNVTIGGNVVLSQSGNVIKGDQLVIDLKTNRSRIVNAGDPTKRQRVQGLFMPMKSGSKKPKKKSPAQ